MHIIAYDGNVIQVVDKERLRFIYLNHRTSAIYGANVGTLVFKRLNFLLLLFGAHFFSSGMRSIVSFA